MEPPDEREVAVMRRWRRGQIAAERRQLELQAAEGPRPQQAVAEALAAFELLRRAEGHPGQRDPISEQQVVEVRRRWARIQKRAQKGR